ncbi:MARCKS-related protein [Pseudophryne corroboree]|uniref:MARCKS-related protein n=1 Tax=Pseudophryne corroboree TaxID=495146 RepID=UPI003081B141
MGGIESKSQSTETAASKAEEQENGHVKTNGDTLQKPNGDTAAANGSAEPVTEEVVPGETIEQAPPTNGDAKPEEPPGKQAKKKRFSFKKPFKLPFRKNKKEAAEEAPAGGEAASPKEETAPEPKAEDPVADSSNPPENPPVEAAAAPPAEEVAAQAEPAEPPQEQSPQIAEPTPSTESPAEPQKEE